MDKEQLLALVEEGFQKPAWHGPNLRGSLRGVNVEEALWRPAKGRHNIWEIVVHAAYWKYTATRRLTRGKKREFPEKGRNWFERGGATVATHEVARRWKGDLGLLSKTHEELRNAITNLNEQHFKRSMRGNRQTSIRNVLGVAMHDAYHAGQIQLLRKLYGER